VPCDAENSRLSFGEGDHVGVARTAPGWFAKAVETPFERGTVTVDGARIRYLHWGGHDDKPGVVLVHGNGAHAHWWTFIAPFLLEHYRVAALDLSGMGDSDHRERYSPEAFAAEVVAVMDAVEFDAETIVIGHSFGGFVTLNTALRHPHRVAGIVLVDSAVRPPDFQWERDPRRSPIRPKRVYNDYAEALARFRLMPPQDCNNQFILDYIGKHSLKETEGGWTWKFDDGLFRKMEFTTNMSDGLKRIGCRVGVIYGQDSYLFSQEVADYMFKVLDESVPFVAIPEAQHHLFLDQPLAFVAALRTLLAEWRHSKPLRAVPL
jgi:pimeloyl-ACP methyl ester carboxylesterase